MHKQHHGPAAQKQKCHTGHQLLAETPDAPDPTQDDRPGQQRGDRPNRQPVPAERGLQRGGDGIGLHHVSAPQRGRHTADGEQRRQKAAAHAPLHVAHGASLPSAVPGAFPVAHRQRLLRTAGHHAQKGGDPHPEHRPRPAVKNGGGHPGDTPGPDGGGQRSGQGLELSQPASLPLPPGPEEGTQRGPEP